MKQITTDDLIKRAEALGVDLGPDKKRRISYLVSKGILDAPRRVGRGRGQGVVGSFPESAVATVVQAHRLHGEGVPFSDVAAELEKTKKSSMTSVENDAMWSGFYDELARILGTMTPDATGALQNGQSPAMPPAEELERIKDAQARLMTAAKKKLVLAQVLGGEDLGVLGKRLDKEMDDAVNELKAATGPKTATRAKRR